MSTNLQTYLADRDEPCPNCRYNLRGLTGNVCPECQQELSLRVGMLDPAWTSLIATIMGLTVGAGMPLCFELFFWGIIVSDDRTVSGDLWVQLVIVPGSVALFFLVALGALLRLKGRRWYRARSVFIRALLAIVAWILPLAIITCWLVWVID